jgi:cytoskeletal protein CcmA (bactofilin family)
MPFWNRQDPHQHAPGSDPAARALTPAFAAPPERKEGNVAILPVKRDEIPTSLGGTSDLLLAAGSEFEGKLNFKGTVRIDALFKGSIQTDDVLIVGEHAKIQADIVCGTVIIQGQVNGNIRAKNGVELRASARVRGDIETPSISAEKGAFLQGALRMESAERKAEQKPPASLPAAMGPGAASAGLP